SRVAEAMVQGMCSQVATVESASGLGLGCRRWILPLVFPGGAGVFAAGSSLCWRNHDATGDDAFRGTHDEGPGADSPARFGDDRCWTVSCAAFVGGAVLWGDRR